VSEPDGGRMTVVEHLAELRHRIIVCLLAVAGGAVIAFILFPQILHWMEAPLKHVLPKEDAKLIITGPLEGFAVRLKVAAYGGIIAASPVILWQTWRFVTPGLYTREKKYAVPFVVSSLILFAAGGVVAVITLKPALNFLLKVGGSGLRPLLKVNDYLTLIFLMIVAFGISFEFPLLLVFLLIARVITTAQLSRWRRAMAVGIVAFAAVITPSQDPISLFAMAVPLYLLYEASIIIGKVLKR
jgi:sec-independent protein translocase protein TatC